MRPLLLYLGLVGAPLLGLFAILEAGKKIVPPRSIGGEWEVEEAFSRESASLCLGPEFARQPLVLHIAQSGTRAELSFGDRERLTLSAVLRGDSLVADGDAPAGTVCPTGTLGLRARLLGEGGAERLSGVLTRVGCEECGGTPFTALRRRVAADR